MGVFASLSPLPAHRRSLLALTVFVCFFACTAFGVSTRFKAIIKIDMYCLVEYRCDLTVAVVQHTDIEHFSPNNVADFDAAKTYQAYWHGNDTTQGGYYDARILHLTETEEEMANHAEKRRKRAVLPSSMKRTSREKEKVAQPTKKLREEVQRKHEMELVDSMEDNIQEETSKCRCAALEEEVRTLHKELGIIKQRLAEKDAAANGLSSCTAECEELKTEVKELRQLNIELQKSLIQKIFSSESRVIYAASMDVHVSAAPPERAQKKKAMLPAPPATPAARHDDLRDLERTAIPATLTKTAATHNVPHHSAQPPVVPTVMPAILPAVPSLQAVMPAVHPEVPSLPALMTSVHPVLPCTDAVASNNGQDMFDLSSVHGRFRKSWQSPDEGDEDIEAEDGSCEFDRAGEQDSIIGSTRDDGKVYAGANAWIDRSAWDVLLKSPTDSMFCRAAAHLYWTPDQMRSRSVTGVLSNKSRSLGMTEVKPALSPEKVSALKALFHVYMGDVEGEEKSKRLKQVRKHLSQKLGDMKRKGTHM